MSGYHNKQAAEILRKIRYATIATAGKDGKPWNSPVAHEYDNQCNIYWFSDKQNQHSQNVRENEDVFIVIYDSTVPEGDGEGVYIEAKAVELTDPKEILSIRKLKKGENYEGKPNDFLGDAVRRIYKAVPQRIWMNDAEVKDGVFIRDYRVEIPLEMVKDLLGA
jgi:nitroimidazol reductase NimA-like FMN-containing flavoprotein (pyridoxamine 5'-phosphate oxidase superfamily)